MVNRIIIDQMVRKICSVQLKPMKHCAELKLKA